MKRSFSIFTISLILAGLMASTAFAQGPTPTDDEVNRIAKQLYCPVCENTPLDVCPTEACRQWRGLIRQQLAEGKSENEIKQYFVENYGARVLSEPPRQGLNWLVYVIPPIIIAAGVLLLVQVLRNWSRLSKAESGTGESPSGMTSEAELVQDEYIAQLEEELKKRK